MRSPCSRGLRTTARVASAAAASSYVKGDCELVRAYGGVNGCLRGMWHHAALCGLRQSGHAPQLPGHCLNDAECSP